MPILIMLIDNVIDYSKKEITHGKMRRFLKTLLKNGLIRSPKKCQLFRKELQYMGNIISIKDRRVCVKPLRKHEIQPLCKELP